MFTKKLLRPFCREEVKPGETETQAIERYIKELEEIDFPFEQIKKETEEIIKKRNKEKFNLNSNSNDIDFDDIFVKTSPIDESLGDKDTLINRTI